MAGPGILGVCRIFPTTISVPFTAFPITILSEAERDGSFTGAAAKLWEFLLCDKFKKVVLVSVQLGPKSTSERRKKKKGISYKFAFWPSPASVSLLKDVMRL